MCDRDGNAGFPASYASLTRRGESEIRRRGSRFFGRAVPVGEEGEVDSVLEEARSTYPDANHHVFAYRIGLGVPRVRYSDDGEPSGTAGMPLLNLLEGRELTGSLLVVSRIFGGTLLGKGGLVRAYTDSGREALRRARPALYVFGHCLRLDVPYETWGTVEHGFHTRGYIPTEVEYGQSVRVDLWIPHDERQEFTAWLADISSGGIVPRERGTKYVARKVIEE